MVQGLCTFEYRAFTQWAKAEQMSSQRHQARSRQDAIHKDTINKVLVHWHHTGVMAAKAKADLTDPALNREEMTLTFPPSAIFQPVSRAFAPTANGFLQTFACPAAARSWNDPTMMADGRPPVSALNFGTLMYSGVNEV